MSNIEKETRNPLVEVKKIIVKHLNLLDKNNDKVKTFGIMDFFDECEKIPLIGLYSKETEKRVIGIIDNLTLRNPAAQSNIIEFLLRIKHETDIVENFIDACLSYGFASRISILNEVCNAQYTALNLEVNWGHKGIQEFYVLNIILAYNSVTIGVSDVN